MTPLARAGMATAIIVVSVASTSTSCWAAECRYDAATRTVLAPPSELGLYQKLAVDAGRIMWTSFLELRPCGAATVTNTDTIRIGAPSSPSQAFEEVDLDLSGGVFAPGATREPSGQSEIEIVFPHGISGLTAITGTAGPDTITFGQSAVALNADGDADVLYDRPLSVGTVLVDARGGDDRISGAGGHGTGRRPTTANLHVWGGSGRDVLLGGRGLDEFVTADGEPDVVDGGAGADTAWVDAGVDRVRSVEHQF